MTLTSKTKTLLVALVVFVGLAAAFGYWRFGRSVEVAVAIARQGAVPLRVLGPGTLQARTAVSLASRVNATVVEVLVARTQVHLLLLAELRTQVLAVVAVQMLLT